jgi:DNA end-binding protein Ku
MIAVGKVVFTSREHIIALEARGKGLVASRCAIPMRFGRKQSTSTTFPTPTKVMLELATHIIETNEFDPKRFEDQYEDALTELLKKKQAGEKIEAPKQREPANVVNLMEALRRALMRRVAQRASSRPALFGIRRELRSQRASRTLPSAARASLPAARLNDPEPDGQTT